MILKYDWNSLYINGASIEFPAAIEKITIFNDKVILLLYSLEGKIVVKSSFDETRNVFCVDVKRNILLWQIEQAGIEDSYSNVSIDDNKLIAITWYGMTYVLDPETGKINNGRFTK